MSEFSHLKNKLLAEQVEDQIYHYILDTPLEPGAKLPNEFALAEKFRVGRSTIREAVKLLSSKGIVEVRQGSGTYVVTTVKGLSDPLNLRSVQDKNALAFDLVNLRLLLEPGIAEIAAQNATDEDIERLRRLCERVETKIHNGDRYIEDDIAFHTCIAESSKNLVVGQLIPIIDTAVMMFTSGTTGEPKGAIITHHNLLCAIDAYTQKLHLTAADSTILAVPIYHITGLSALLALFISLGASIWLQHRFNAPQVINTLREQNITFLHGSPTIFARLRASRAPAIQAISPRCARLPAARAT